MLTANLAFAKIVATPTDTSWSQVYNAGGLFAVVALTTPPKDEERETDLSLAEIGKSVINTLESEFFTLEDKSLTSIKHALKQVLPHVTKDVTFSLVLAFVKQSILYVFIIGEGKILLKRGERLGTLLVRDEKSSSQEILSASGYLQNNDYLLLSSSHFSEILSQEKLSEAFSLTLPTDIAETLSPTIHASDDGAASALVLTFQGLPQVAESEDQTLLEKEEKDQEEETLGNISHSSPPSSLPRRSFLKPFLRRIALLGHALPLPKMPFANQKKKQLILAVALILLVVLGVSIASTKSAEGDISRKEQFEKVYTPAKKLYDQALELESLNKSLAREDYLKAKALLEKSQSQFPEKSEERAKINSLLSQINEHVGDGATLHPVTAKEVPAEDSPLLKIVLEHSDTISAAQDASYYLITSKNIQELEGASDKGKSIITNDEDWTLPVSLGAYLGNVYVLDKKEGIIKFVAGSDGYGKSSYFTSDQDVSKTVSLAIDGSIWLLNSDGSIRKYTRGNKEDFSIKDLPTPLKNPTRIMTDVDTDNLYILDNGNQRIVVLSKDGNYVGELQSPVLGKATFATVDEEKKTAFVLSEKKVYSLPLE